MNALSLKDAAKRLACSVDTVRADIRAGRLYAIQVGGGTKRKKLVVPDSEIERRLSPAEPKTSTSKRRRSLTPKSRRY